YPVRDLHAVDIQLALTRAPALADVSGDIDDLKGGQKSVLDALFQAVGKDRITKVVQVGDVLGLLRSGSHADLRGRGEILQNLSPAALLCGRTSVTLVHNDEVKEVRGEEAAVMLFAVVPHKLLIQREV